MIYFSCEVKVYQYLMKVVAIITTVAIFFFLY
nr:MAG TPA: hypothetical protein [Caudoviricetes sp.]